MKIISLVVYCCLLNFYAAAQSPKTYAETRREQDLKKYNEDFIEGTKYNRNTPTRTNSNSGDNSAAQALADQWRRNSGRRTDAEQKEWEQNAAGREEARKQQEAAKQEKARKLDQEIAALNARRAETEATRRPAFEKNRANYLDLGFNAQEADRFAWSVTKYPDGSRAPGTEVEQAAVDRAITARKKYNTIKNTGTYEELANLIPQMHAASFASMQAWQDLAQRFPDKQGETERWEFWAMPAIFERHPNDHPAVKDLQEKATERFFELFTRQPAAAINAVQAFSVDYYHPIYRSGMYGKMNTDEGRRWAEVMLLSTNNYSQYNRRDEWRKEMFESTWSAAYWKKKTNADWYALSQMADITLVAVFERLTNVTNNWIALGAGKKGALHTNNYFKTSNQFLWEEIAELAAAGEPSCMNAYGYYLAGDNKRSGKDRKRGIELLQQAVDAGLLWAPLNILFLAEAGVEYAPSIDSALSQARRILANATPQQRYMVAYELKKRAEMNYIDSKHARTAITFAKQAANAGHRDGQILYTRPDWIDLGEKPGVIMEKDWGKQYAGLTVPGQRTLFTSWPSAVVALPHFKLLIQDSLSNKDFITYTFNEALVVLPRTREIGGYTGKLLLPNEKTTEYTLKMNFSMIQNPLPDGLFGLLWKGQFVSSPAIYFMINPAKKQYYFGSQSSGEAFKPYHTSRSEGKGYSNSINTWNSQFYSSNEIGVERKGNQVKLLINGDVIEVVDIAPYTKVFDNFSHIGYGYGEGRYTAWIRDFFVSVKD